MHFPPPSPYREADEGWAAAVPQSVGHDGDVARAGTRQRHRHLLRPKVDADGSRGSTHDEEQQQRRRHRREKEASLAEARHDGLRAGSAVSVAAMGCRMYAGDQHVQVCVRQLVRE